MPNIMQILRSATANLRPTGRAYGEIFWNNTDRVLGIIDATQQPRDLWIDFLRTRDDLSTYMNNGGVLPIGKIIYCDGHFYQEASGATDVFDIPGVVPFGTATPYHFGAKGNLEWIQVSAGDLPGSNASAYGPRRLSGDNDATAILLADYWARTKGDGHVDLIGDFYAGLVIPYRSTEGATVFAFDWWVENPSDLHVYTNDPDGDSGLPVDADSGERAEAQKQVLKYTSNPTPASGEFTVQLNSNNIGGTVTISAPVASDVGVYVSRTLECHSKWRQRGVLWTQYGLTNQGVAIKASGAEFDGDRIIGQYNYDGFKPGNNGQWGPVITVSTGYYTEEDHELIRDVKVKALLCRAPRLASDSGAGVAFQDSDGAIYSTYFGNVRNCRHEVGVFGSTSRGSNMVVLCHWGCRYTPPGGAETIDKTPYTIEKQWLPQAIDITFLSPFKNDEHEMDRVWELACAADCTIGTAVSDGLTYGWWIGVGDVLDRFALADQKGRGNKGHRIGMQVHTNLRATNYGCLVKGGGTSKFEAKPGVPSEFMQFSGDLDVVFEGNHIHAPDATETIRFRQGNGRVDLGVCRLTGSTTTPTLTGSTQADQRISLFVANTWCNWSADIEYADGPIYVRNSANGTLHRTNVDMGTFRYNLDTQDPPQPILGILRQGYEAENAAVLLLGSNYSIGTVRAASTIGETTLYVNPWSAGDGGFNQVCPGQELEIALGDGTTITAKVTDYALNDQNEIYVEPLAKAVDAAAVIHTNRTIHMKYVGLSSQSSEFGLQVEQEGTNMARGKIDHVELFNTGWSGRNILRAKRTNLKLTGTVKGSGSRRVVSTSSAPGIWADSWSNIIGQDLNILKNTSSNPSFQIAGIGDERSRITLINCVVEEASSLYNSSAQAAQVVQINCVDAANELVPDYVP